MFLLLNLTIGIIQYVIFAFQTLTFPYYAYHGFPKRCNPYQCGYVSAYRDATLHDFILAWIILIGVFLLILNEYKLIEFVIPKKGTSIPSIIIPIPSLIVTQTNNIPDDKERDKVVSVLHPPISTRRSVRLQDKNK